MTVCALLGFAVAAFGACEVDNPAYGPTAVAGIDGAATEDDARLPLPEEDAGDGIDLESSIAVLDVAAPPDLGFLRPDTSQSVDTVMPLPPDAAEPPPVDAPAEPPPVDAPAEPPPVDAPVNPLPVDAPTTAPRPCPNDPDLVICLGFEGAAVDESPSPVALTKSALTFEDGPSGLALLSTARTTIVNDSVMNLGLPAVTIAGWVKPSALPATGSRFGIVDYQPQYALFLESGGQLTCGCDGTRIITTAPLVKVGVWQSVACTMDDAYITIWIDGVARAMKRIFGFCPAPLDAQGLAILGNHTSGGSSQPESFQGSADNIRVWRRARTAAEICSDALGCK